jgi:hypothetical protein
LKHNALHLLLKELSVLTKMLSQNEINATTDAEEEEGQEQEDENDVSWSCNVMQTLLLTRMSQ